MTRDEDLLRRADMARTGATAHEMNRLRNAYTHYVYHADLLSRSGDDEAAARCEKLAKYYAGKLERFIATGIKE